MIIRDSIFIGHATPQDNEFTLWLQSKLISEGYKCECDLTFLIGGEADYWTNIQNFLENQTAKYILVISDITFKSSGVLDEWEQCKSIEKDFNLNDFIIPVKIDESRLNARIGLNRRNIIFFEKNWAIGLKRLIKKLQNDNVPSNPDYTGLLNHWYENVYTNWTGIKRDINDTFYSNWIKISKIPNEIFFYKFENEKQACVVLENNMVYPSYRHGNIVVSFQKHLNYFLQDRGFEIIPSEIITKHTTDAFTWYEEDLFPTYHDFRRLLVRLINLCFEMYLNGLDLLCYKLANSKCYYFEHKTENKVKGTFSIGENQHNIGVTGNFLGDFWHYGISFNTLLNPEFCVSIKNHIIFTTDGNKAWKDKKSMHRARRKKGKNMHNKEWRNLLLAFLSALTNQESSIISIMVAESEVIEIPSLPILFKANFGYIEPSDKERLIPVDNYLEEEDYYEEIEKATEDD